MGKYAECRVVKPPPLDAEQFMPGPGTGSPAGAETYVSNVDWKSSAAGKGITTKARISSLLKSGKVKNQTVIDQATPLPAPTRLLLPFFNTGDGLTASPRPSDTGSKGSCDSSVFAFSNSSCVSTASVQQVSDEQTGAGQQKEIRSPSWRAPSNTSIGSSDVDSDSCEDDDDFPPEDMQYHSSDRRQSSNQSTAKSLPSATLSSLFRKANRNKNTFHLKGIRSLVSSASALEPTQEDDSCAPEQESPVQRSQSEDKFGIRMSHRPKKVISLQNIHRPYQQSTSSSQGGSGPDTPSDNDDVYLSAAGNAPSQPVTPVASRTKVPPSPTAALRRASSEARKATLDAGKNFLRSKNSFFQPREKRARRKPLDVGAVLAAAPLYNFSVDESCFEGIRLYAELETPSALTSYETSSSSSEDEVDQDRKLKGIVEKSATDDSEDEEEQDITIMALASPTNGVDEILELPPSFSNLDFGRLPMSPLYRLGQIGDHHSDFIHRGSSKIRRRSRHLTLSSVDLAQGIARNKTVRLPRTHSTGEQVGASLSKDSIQVMTQPSTITRRRSMVYSQESAPRFFKEVEERQRGSLSTLSPRLPNAQSDMCHSTEGSSGGERECAVEIMQTTFTIRHDCSSPDADDENRNRSVTERKCPQSPAHSS